MKTSGPITPTRMAAIKLRRSTERTGESGPVVDTSTPQTEAASAHPTRRRRSTSATAGKNHAFCRRKSTRSPRTHRAAGAPPAPQPAKTTLFAGGTAPGHRAPNAPQALHQRHSRQKPRFLPAEKHPVSARPVPRQSNKSYVDDLHGGVFLQTVHIELDSDARALDSAERRHRVQVAMLVHPRGTAFELAGIARCFFRIVAPDRSAEADFQCVRPRDRFLDSLVFDVRYHWFVLFFFF